MQKQMKATLEMCLWKWKIKKSFKANSFIQSDYQLGKGFFFCFIHFVLQKTRLKDELTQKWKSSHCVLSLMSMEKSGEVS